MANKIFNLLEKMYAGLKQDINGVKQQVTSINERVSTIEKRVTSIDNTVTRIENEHDRKIDLALDGYRQVYEKLLEHDLRFDTLEARLDTHDTQIGVLKKKNA